MQTKTTSHNAAPVTATFLKDNSETERGVGHEAEDELSWRARGGCSEKRRSAV